MRYLPVAWFTHLLSVKAVREINEDMSFLTLRATESSPVFRIDGYCAGAQLGISGVFSSQLKLKPQNSNVKKIVTFGEMSGVACLGRPLNNKKNKENPMSHPYKGGTGVLEGDWCWGSSPRLRGGERVA